MTVAARHLAEQALSLPETDRAELIALLSRSLPAEALSPGEWDQAWQGALNKRMEEIESGR